MLAARPALAALLLLVTALACGGATGTGSRSAGGQGWERWRHVAGVFDVSGPRSDGRLVVATSGHMKLASASGTVTPFAGGPQGYADDAGTEAYLAVSPGRPVAGAGCSFAPDDVFVLRLHPPYGVTRVTAAGAAQPFATIPGVESLNGIAFDQTGRFGSRLLVTGPSHGRTVVVAVDCNGRTQVITAAAPVVEGGLAVAPAGFGPFGGDLVAPDELSGRIFAIEPGGTSRVIAASGLPTGGDIGVESVGFAPAGFTAGGDVYYADRATPGNRHPGTDTLLRLGSAPLQARGVRDGDLLAATEGGALLIAVHCGGSHQSCSVIHVVTTATTAHGEGHLAVVASHPG